MCLLRGLQWIAANSRHIPIWFPYVFHSCRTPVQRGEPVWRLPKGRQIQLENDQTCCLWRQNTRTRNLAFATDFLQTNKFPQKRFKKSKIWSDKIILKIEKEKDKVWKMSIIFRQMCQKKKEKESYLSRGSPHKLMLVSPQNIWAENASYRCWIRKSCQRDCSLDFDKLVAWYKTCNKAPNDQQKMIYKRDRQERNRIPSYRCCMINLHTRARIRKKIMMRRAAILSELCK